MNDDENTSENFTNGWSPERAEKMTLDEARQIVASDGRQFKLCLAFQVPRKATRMHAVLTAAEVGKSLAQDVMREFLIAEIAERKIAEAEKGAETLATVEADDSKAETSPEAAASVASELARFAKASA